MADLPPYPDSNSDTEPDIGVRSNRSMQPATQSSNKLGGTLGTCRDWRRRLLLHHVPLALASAVLLVLFMTLPPFDPQAYPQVDMSGGVFLQQVEPMAHAEDQTGRMDHAEDQTGPVEDEIPQQQGEDQQHGGDQTGSVEDSGGHASRQSRSFTQRVTTATGYVALGLLTLLIGPANLLLRKRNPVSNYLRRDVGTWTAIVSVVHVIFGLQLHSGQLSDVLNYFVVDGSPLTNSFGLGNWTGLAATVIVVGVWLWRRRHSVLG